jgi:AcrR family transcriptional regulator
MSNKTRSFTRLDVDTRRRELLRAGCELFAAQPYDEVWIDDVARHAGVSRGLLYHYFGSKRGFLTAIVEHEAAELVRVTEPDPALPPQQRLDAVLDAYLDYLEAHPQGYRAIYRGAAGADTGIRAIMDTNLHHQEQRLLAALAGDAPATDALRLAVHGWLAFLIATCLAWLDNPTLDRTSLRNLCARTLTGAVLASGTDLLGTSTGAGTTATAQTSVDVANT